MKNCNKYRKTAKKDNVMRDSYIKQFNILFHGVKKKVGSKGTKEKRKQLLKTY